MALTNRTPRALLKFRLAILSCLFFFTLGFAQDKQLPKASAAPAIGLEVGQSAPAFSSTDQFDHKQSNETLKGSAGTVLLFFRSADW